MKGPKARSPAVDIASIIAYTRGQSFSRGLVISTRVLIAAGVLLLAVRPTFADETIYRYEGNVLPDDPAAGWLVFQPCEDPCSVSIQDGHVFLEWDGEDSVNYNLRIAEPPVEPPPTLWIEWRFRSSQRFGGIFPTCDGTFFVQYRDIADGVFMFGDATVSHDFGTVVQDLDVEQFNTYRFESLDGINYRFSVDGLVFVERADSGGSPVTTLSMRGSGGCELKQLPNVNEWDFVRYGTISFGETIVSADPPAGFLDPAQFADLDRFTVTFNAANYVYLDEITVEVTGGVAPTVIKTRRRENDGPETVEIVLDRPMPLNETTRFTFDDGQVTNTIEYTLVAPPPIPTLSDWGLAAMGALTLACGVLILNRRRNPMR